MQYFTYLKFTRFEYHLNTFKCIKIHSQSPSSSIFWLDCFRTSMPLSKTKKNWTKYRKYLFEGGSGRVEPGEVTPTFGCVWVAFALSQKERLRGPVFNKGWQLRTWAKLVAVSPASERRIGVLDPTPGWGPCKNTELSVGPRGLHPGGKSKQERDRPTQDLTSSGEPAWHRRGQRGHAYSWAAFQKEKKYSPLDDDIIKCLRTPVTFPLGHVCLRSFLPGLFIWIYLYFAIIFQGYSSYLKRLHLHLTFMSCPLLVTIVNSNVLHPCNLLRKQILSILTATHTCTLSNYSYVRWWIC